MKGHGSDTYLAGPLECFVIVRTLQEVPDAPSLMLVLKPRVAGIESLDILNYKLSGRAIARWATGSPSSPSRRQLRRTSGCRGRCLNKRHAASARTDAHGRKRPVILK